jgi:eukaryotic-like serine/threonine-protein kinase
MEGTQVGAYRIVQQIGEGGMGSVWLAEHTMLGRRAAVKLLHPSFSSRQDIVQRFFNEARAATSISDPGIVQIFDFGHHTDGQAYIVMELLDGEPLDRRLQRQGKLAVNEAMRIMRQVASSLGAAHARGIIHRGLKPENIFMVRDPEVSGGERAKILDFGIAKLGEQSNVKTQTNALMGTPSYMSPEQCRGSGGLDARSDIYALGCVFFALVTGLPPFVAEGHGELIVMHITAPAPLLSSRAQHVPASLDALVAKCLEKDREQRYANGTELAKAIGMLMSSVSQTGMTGSMSATGEPLPVHQQITAPSPDVKQDTTLGGAVGSRSVLTTTDGKPKKLVLGAILGVAAAAGALAVFVITSGKDKNNKGDVAAAAPITDTASEPPTPTPQPTPTPTPVPAPTPAPATDPVSEPAPTTVTPATVAITITSQPPGAQVFVGHDKKPRGTTPMTLEVKQADPAFEIKLVAKGYLPTKKTVSPASDNTIDVTLSKPKSTGGKKTGGGEDSDDVMSPFGKK